MFQLQRLGNVEVGVRAGEAFAILKGPAETSKKVIGYQPDAARPAHHRLFLIPPY